MWDRRYPSAARLTVMAACALCASIASASEKVVLDGSSGMLPFAKALAAAYMKSDPDARVEVGMGMGTGARLRALADGTIQIALASHGVSPEDVRKNDLRVIELAKSAIVFAVPSSVPVTGITETQACDVYSGRVKTWQKLGAPDVAIVVLTRPASEVDPEVIRAKIGCFKDLKEVDGARVMARGGDMAKALAETPHALGITSMTVVQQSAGAVRALELNGIAATNDNVRSGRYFLSRDFMLVVKGEPRGPVKRFLDFALSEEGDRVALANGAIPLR